MNLYCTASDADWAWSFLNERSRALHLGDPVIVDALVELAGAGVHTDALTDLAEDVARRIGNLIEQGQLDDARARLHSAGRTLSRFERARLYHRIADRLERKRAFAVAAEVMMELTDAACGTGDLAEATAAVQRAAGLLVLAIGAGTGTDTWARSKPDDSARNESDDSLRNRLSATIARVDSAWKSCEVLVEWRKSDDERRHEAVRARFAGRRILIAGGLRVPEWEARLRDLSGAEIDWAEKYREQGDDLRRFAERIRAGHYALVIHLLQKSGHEVQDQLKSACDNTNVTWESTPTGGWRGVEAAVEKAALRADTLS